MGRPKKQAREPYWLAKRNCYFVHVGTRTIRLSPDKDEAWRLWHEIMARPPEQRRLLPAGPDAYVVEILDAFLEWCQKHKARATYAWYLENIGNSPPPFLRTLKVADLKPYHLTQAMDGHDWGNNTKHNFIAATKPALGWAKAEGLIDANPIAHVSKPSREACDVAVSPAEYQKIIAAIQSPHFRDLIELTWECGARPQETPKIEARFFDADNGLIVFPPKEAKGKKYHRVIYLTSRAKEIVTRLAAEHPEGPLLLNEDGNPWNKNSINCVFHRLQKRVGRKYHLGQFRKGYATQALKSGVDVISLSHLLGHRDTAMLARVYAKVQADPEFMRQQAKKAKGGGA